ncbi:MAG: hypothetical protein H6741_35860 [Alphaproteobacteria bacterium]|nr:hypothetical protein [Alphaproteobacteria bacterium]
MLAAVVRDAEDVERRVPLEVGPEKPLATSVWQSRDDQGHVTLRLEYRGAPLGEVRIDMPPAPRGEEVWVWIELEGPGRLLVELEHRGRVVERVFTLDPPFAG